ncbi:hypothetical protein GCM10007100_40230 [Roseibacillus persicicus]|uniref:Uncharacterized protein n=2 Tax=Roseibacillus persicicus TaxID=454148 RepID=A0A918TY92_9BACT|nr:hypothetical protein GCM10007100_40230 [Roseibacillus persicicus]
MCSYSGAEVQAPAELLTIVEKREELVRDLDEKYLSSLAKLRAKYVSAGKSEEVALVTKFIELAEMPKVSAREELLGKKEKPSFLPSILNKKWQWKHGRNANVIDWIILNPAGTIRANWLDDAKWEQVGERKIRIYKKSKGKEIFTILEWNEDVTEYKGSGLNVPTNRVSGCLLE